MIVKARCDMNCCTENGTPRGSSVGESARKLIGAVITKGGSKRGSKLVSNLTE